jgi:ribose-phosphate pyrophosphokinase
MILLNGKEVIFKTFPNGETLVDNKSIIEAIDTMYMYETKTANVSFKYENDSDLIKLMFLKNILDPFRMKTYNLTIYYMPYSRMDRSESGSPFTLKYIANFINSLKFDSIEVIEPHSDVTCAVLNNATSNMINFKLLPKVMEDIGFHPAYDYIVFPDAGAGKRYSKILAPNIIIGNKKRDFTNGKILGLELIGNIDSTYGKKAVICDDLTSYGTTFVQTSKALKEKGIEEVYLLVAHTEPNAFVRHPATNDLLLEHIDRLYTTDSILNEEDLSIVGRSREEIEKGLDKLKVYKLEELLSN